MEGLILLLLVVFFLVYLNQQSTLRETLQRISNRLQYLQDENRKLEELLREQAPKEKPVTPTPIPPPAFKPRPVVPRKELLPDPQHQTEPVEKAAASMVQPPLPEEKRLDKFLRDNPDLEKFIGENLINKIGIAILVLGIAFFVKYAIDRNWINEAGRVSIGLFCGAALVGLAHYLRNSYRSFSSVLAGGGLAVFYFTIAFAYHQYALIPQTAAFLIMVVITSFAVALSVLYNKVELSVIATVGGFLTPFLVSSGEGNYIVLFTYLLILNAGLLALAVFKRWPIINILALLFTILISAGWLVEALPDDSGKVSYPLALLLIESLYLLFIGMNMVWQLRNSKRFRPLDFSILLFLTGVFYAEGMALLHWVDNGKWQGLFTLGVGSINFFLARFLYRRSDADRTLVYLLIGLTLTFLSLAVPVQLNGRTITLFWSAEFVLLYWLFQRSGIKLFRVGSQVIALLAAISMMMDWQQTAVRPSGLILIYSNIQGIATNLVATLAFGLYAYLLRKNGKADKFLPAVSNKDAFSIYLAVSIGLLYLTALFGVNLAFCDLNSYAVPNVFYRLITEAFVIAGLWFIHRHAKGRLWWFVLLSVFLVVLMQLFSTGLVEELRNGALKGSVNRAYLLLHGLSVGVLLSLVFYAIRVIRRQTAVFAPLYRNLIWISSALLVVVFSIECWHLYVVAGSGSYTIDQLEQQYSKAVLTIVWALCSFAMMWLGMRHKNKTLRIAALSLFAVALLKLFFADIRNVSEGGKILAFILLGVLLLTISFMYQKLKKILIDETV